MTPKVALRHGSLASNRGEAHLEQRRDRIGCVHEAVVLCLNLAKVEIGLRQNRLPVKRQCEIDNHPRRKPTDLARSVPSEQPNLLAVPSAARPRHLRPARDSSSSVAQDAKHPRPRRPRSKIWLRDMQPREQQAIHLQPTVEHAR